MTKLEFINELIKERKEYKDRFILSFERYSDDEVVTRCVKSYEQEIQILEQIKTILEAWEVVEEEIEYEEDVPCNERPEYTYKFKKWKFKLTEDDYNFEEKDKKLKKALEIENE